MTVNSILTRDCKEARNEWFPRAIPCKEEMLCSRGSTKFWNYNMNNNNYIMILFWSLSIPYKNAFIDHVCANFGWDHCNYACLSTCMCDGVLTVRVLWKLTSSNLREVIKLYVYLKIRVLFFLNFTRSCQISWDIWSLLCLPWSEIETKWA